MTTKLWGLLPHYDCGFCKNPSCSTFSRRIAAGMQKPEDCCFLREPNLGKIHDLLKEDLQLGSRSGVQLGLEGSEKEGIVEIEPCAEYGKVTLEAQLPRPSKSVFDVLAMDELKPLLEEVGFLERVRCSVELGYALAEYGDSKIHIFKTAKLVMRRVENTDIAMQLFKSLSRLLWGSVICWCGNSGIDCVGGGCMYCLDEVCPVLIWGISGKTDYGEETGKTVFSRVKNLNYDEPFFKGIEKLDRVIELLEEIGEKITEKNLMDEERENYRKLSQTLLKDARRFASKFMISVARDQDAALGLVLRGLERDLARIFDGFLSLNSDTDIRLFSQARDFVFRAYKAFKEGDDVEAKKLKKEYGSFFKEWEKNGSNESNHVNVLKIASSGRFISGIITRKLPG